jgi:quercetin dioxygenase-like cupin family protein
VHWRNRAQRNEPGALLGDAPWRRLACAGKPFESLRQLARIPPFESLKHHFQQEMNGVNHGHRRLIGALALALALAGCSSSRNATLPPEPIVNHLPSDAQPGERIEHGELILNVDEAKQQLHAQHHPHQVVETRRVPGPFQQPAMKDVKDFLLSKSELDVINPGPGEYVHVMEGRRHGYRNLTIGITYTAPGGAPPMHTHEGEESHVVLSGQKILYALGDKLFVAEGPYILNIPPMVPHSFQNLDDEVAELVVIFPTNLWEYDVLNVFPFASAEAKALAEEARRGTTRPARE